MSGKLGMRTRAYASRHPMAVYVVVAYMLSWSWWVPMAIGGATTRPGQGWPTHVPGLMGPAIAAIVVTALTNGSPGLRDLAARLTRWRVPGRWYVLIATTAAMLALAPLTRWATGEPLPASVDYVTYSGVGPLPAALTVLIVLVVNGFGEEVGWRGFLVDRLLPRNGLIRTALIVAPIWGLWHMPMFWFVGNLVGLGIGGTIGWCVGLTAGSILLAWLYAFSGRSIAIVSLWHVAFNFATATDAATGVPAATASTLVMVVALGIVAWAWRRRPLSLP
jgi:membrane protease YdiL (CAAX protease family)